MIIGNYRGNLLSMYIIKGVAPGEPGGKRMCNQDTEGSQDS